ncbi:MAG: Ig-like domain-containing protein [Oscillospiraceae bacterium]|nr:Ig-like domain-containing protein [Oscillospiraceae bacterium]
MKGKVGKVTFTSSNKKVATVNGKVVAKNKGKATITVLTNGNIKLKCKITVK